MMNNWQEWAVLAILLICLIVLIYKMIVFFKRTKRNESPCSGCAHSCKSKHQLDCSTGNCLDKAIVDSKKNNI